MWNQSGCQEMAVYYKMWRCLTGVPPGKLQSQASPQACSQKKNLVLYTPIDTSDRVLTLLHFVCAIFLKTIHMAEFLES